MKYLMPGIPVEAVRPWPIYPAVAGVIPFPVPMLWAVLILLASLAIVGVLLWLVSGGSTTKAGNGEEPRIHRPSDVSTNDDVNLKEAA
jgi:hypothetical protein